MVQQCQTLETTGSCVSGRCLASAADKGLGDDSDAALAFLRAVPNRSEIAALLGTGAVSNALADLLWMHVQTLQRAGVATTGEIQSKFSGALELSYRGLDSFFGGLERVVGPPHNKVLEAMEREHTSGPEAAEEFVTSNYGITTTSTVEWSFVAAPDAAPEHHQLERWPEEARDRMPDRGRCRQRRGLDDLQDEVKAKNALLDAANQPQLVEAEVLAARLYTGPVRRPAHARFMHARGPLP